MKNLMKTLANNCAVVVLIAIVVLLGERSSFAQDTAAVSVEDAQLAQDAADAWLALIDSTDYEASWQQAAPFFQQQMSQEAWGQALRSVRGPLGPLMKRTPQDREYTTALPNAPEGEYVVIVYVSAYTQLENAIETVTMTKTDDGTWKALGYIVRPAS